MADEAAVTIGTGQNLRNLAVQTYVNGVLTTVLMEVVSIADSNGNIINNFADYNFQTEVLRSLKAILLQLSLITNQQVSADTLLEGEL